jgi:hypothetical protein
MYKNENIYTTSLWSDLFWMKKCWWFSNRYKVKEDDGGKTRSFNSFYLPSSTINDYYILWKGLTSFSHSDNYSTDWSPLLDNSSLVKPTYKYEQISALRVWSFDYSGLLSPEIHLCGEPTAIDIIKRLVDSCGDDFEVKYRH